MIGLRSINENQSRAEAAILENAESNLIGSARARQRERERERERERDVRRVGDVANLPV